MQLKKIAQLYQTGKDLPLDMKEAAKYYKKAADKGSPSAMYEYTTMLRNGSGVNENLNLAAKYFKMSAERGNIHSMNSYGLMSLTGEIDCDKVEAAQYLLNAAKSGYGLAIYNYGVALYKGHGVPISQSEAIKCFKIAANKGVKKAKETLNSIGVSNDCLIC